MSSGELTGAAACVTQGREFATGPTFLSLFLSLCFWQGRGGGEAGAGGRWPPQCARAQTRTASPLGSSRPSPGELGAQGTRFLISRQVMQSIIEKREEPVRSSSL